ncbi:unnamed protein product [Prorocentrum cordatum]|uniref:O-fucosyltransferase family protein n=1 Tax=Prorocentrum cordatum TaxID=2364126 RepID=A0ABN9Q7E7_9DINO|nr:unnamed protein product [Polarella glacialis]
MENMAGTLPASAVAIVDDDAPGLYCLTNGALVTAAAATASPEVARLGQGSTVRVLEVRRLADAQRVRGRIENPPGWISLLDLSDGFRWVERLEPLPVRVPAAVPGVVAGSQGHGLRCQGLLRSLRIHIGFAVAILAFAGELCEHPHGLFSMFSMAMGQVELRRRYGQALLVDWSWEGLLYRGPAGEPNLWNAFFRQPAELQMGRAELLGALRQKQYHQTTSSDAVYGGFSGVVQDYGAISPAKAAHGRELCRRSFVLQGAFEARIQAVASVLLGGGHRWLAVHVRQTDKGCEASANLELSEENVATRVVAQCGAWGLDAVFLCSDSAALKANKSL